jgi:hypothetical protein
MSDPEKIEKLKTMMLELIERDGWEALERIFVEELGFQRVENRQTYRHPDGSEVIFTEGVEAEEALWYCPICESLQEGKMVHCDECGMFFDENGNPRAH